jgi:hypothetical protein
MLVMVWVLHTLDDAYARGDISKGARMNKVPADMPGAEALAHLSSRKDFLKMAGAAGLGAALGSNILLRQALAINPTGPTQGSFKFATTNSYYPFDVISNNFVEHSDSFTSQGSYTVLAPAPVRRSGSVSTGGSALSVTSTPPFFALFQTNKAPLAPYASVVVDVKSFIGSANKQDTVYAGLIKDASNYVVAWYNNETNRVGIDAVVGGTVNRLVETVAPPDISARFAFVLNSKEVTALYDTGNAAGPTGSTWKPVANFPNPPEVKGDPAITPGLSQYVDLRDPAVLAQYKYGFGVRGDGGTIALDGVEAGYWGRAGVRDPHVVTWADGTPYIKDNKLYFTLTNAGLDFFATAHWGVYTLNLSNYTSPAALEEVGKIFFKRDGKVFGDHAGHIVYDGTNFLIGVSTWGDFTYQGVHVNYTSDVVQHEGKPPLHGVHVLEPQKLNLPTVSPTDTGTWDPHFVKIDGQWYVAFVDSPSQGNPWKHFPALAKGPDLEHLTLVGAESDLQQSEGMVIQKIAGKWYVLCSSGGGEITDEDAGSATYRIYEPVADQSGGLKFVGKLRAPYVSNIPHPMVTPLPVGQNTKWIMLTFDGTDFYGWDQKGNPILDYGTHGKFYVMDGPTWDGYHEFPPR